MNTLLAVIFALCGVLATMVASRYIDMAAEVKDVKADQVILRKQMSDTAIATAQASAIAAQAATIAAQAVRK